jgi:hypothetical protein
MKNLVTQETAKKAVKRRLTDDQIIRLKSCAVIAMGDNPNKFASPNHALKYCVKTCKGMITTGQARNYTDAIEKLECLQVGDRGDPITRSISQDDTNRVVTRINRINKGINTVVNGHNYLYDYDQIIDGIKLAHYTITDTITNNPSNRAMGKVLGTLYTEYDKRINELDPAKEMMKQKNDKQLKKIEQNLKLFYADYFDHVSEKAKNILLQLADSDHDITTDQRRKGDKLANSVYRIYESFTHRDTVKFSDFIAQIRKYLPHRVKFTDKQKEEFSALIAEFNADNEPLSIMNYNLQPR